MIDSIIVYVVAILGIILYTYMIISSIRDAKKARRTPPNGKVFIKEFISIIDDLIHTQEFAKVESIWALKERMTFKVRVEEEIMQKGLQFETIPRYKSYLIYINDEPVLREHIIDINYKKVTNFEFSSKRDKLEVVDIITEAHKQTKEIREARNKEINERLGFGTGNKSFYDVEE